MLVANPWLGPLPYTASAHSCCGESPYAVGLNSGPPVIGRCMLRVAVADQPTHWEAPSTTPLNFYRLNTLMKQNLYSKDELDICLRKFAKESRDGRFEVDISNDGARYEVWVKDSSLVRYNRLPAGGLVATESDLPIDRKSLEAFAIKFFEPHGLTWAELSEMNDEQLQSLIDGIHLWAATKAKGNHPVH